MKRSLQRLQREPEVLNEVTSFLRRSRWNEERSQQSSTISWRTPPKQPRCASIHLRRAPGTALWLATCEEATDTSAPPCSFCASEGQLWTCGVAQAPQCEPCKSTGLHPSCLLYEDKTRIFTTLLFLWKGHRLVWNIKQRMPLEIKGTLEESGKLQKGFDGIYRSISSRYDGMKE